MKILVIGWTRIPHSYSIVNVFQLVHLHKNFPNIKIYLREEEYYRKEWSEKASNSLYPEEYYKILDSFETWVGQDIDIIYSITFPYDINSLKIERAGVVSPPLPKCVFYTSEFGKLDISYFKLSTANKIMDDEFIKMYLEANKNIYFTSPSGWSAKGMQKYLEDDNGDSRNLVISHGVDTDIFKKTSPNIRSKIRKFYNIKDSDIVLCNIGAMTRNKGIVQILEALKILVVEKGFKRYKLLLKGMQDLYATRQFVGAYLQEINAPPELMSHIIFIDKTLSCVYLNEIYNSIDLYLSPYVAEGFNLVPLEVLASGTRVMLPRGGSTSEYTSALEKFKCIQFVDCQLDVSSGCNVYQIKDIVSGILASESSERFNHKTINKFISENLSWNNAAKSLYKYLGEIVENTECKK